MSSPSAPMAGSSAGARRYSRVSAVWASFYARELYRQAAMQWTGSGALYLLLLLALAWLPSAVRWHTAARAFAAREGAAIVRQFPEVSIGGGVMTANPPGRHVIDLGAGTNASAGQIIVDDSTDTVPAEADGDTFVVTRREVGVIRPSRGERRVWTIGPDTQVHVTPEAIDGFLTQLAWWVGPLGYVAALGGALAFRLVQVLVYAAAAREYAARRGLTLDLPSAMRVCAVAITPVVVIRTLLWFGPWDPVWYIRWPAAILITGAYIHLAIGANRRVPAVSEVAV